MIDWSNKYSYFTSNTLLSQTISISKCFFIDSTELSCIAVKYEANWIKARHVVHYIPIDKTTASTETIPTLEVWFALTSLKTYYNTCA